MAIALLRGSGSSLTRSAVKNANGKRSRTTAPAAPCLKAKFAATITRAFVRERTAESNTSIQNAAEIIQCQSVERKASQRRAKEKVRKETNEERVRRNDG